MNIPLLIVILYVLLLFCISIYVSCSQKKDSENFLLYKGKNNAFVVAASIAGLAIGGERGKSGNAHDNRHCDADAGQGAGTDVRDMADVHAVNHVIENVDDLCGNCRERQFKKK